MTVRIRTTAFGRTARFAIAATAALLATTGIANAAEIVFSNTTVRWFNPTAADSATLATVNYTGLLTNDAQVAWGAPSPPNGPQSAFRFATAGNIITTSPAMAFTLGTFTHSNNPITLALTGVSLQLVSDVSVDGVAIGSRSFEYSFLINETPNAPPCGFGGDTNPCADSVTIAASPNSQTFDVGGVAYTLAFSAFNIAGVETPGFISPENGTNFAQLRALVTVPSGVPEPTTWAMMIMGFGVVGGAMRRRTISKVGFA